MRLLVWCMVCDGWRGKTGSVSEFVFEWCFSYWQAKGVCRFVFGASVRRRKLKLDIILLTRRRPFLWSIYSAAAAHLTNRQKMVDLISSMINHNVLEVIFSYLDLRDLRNCAVVCRSWKHFLDDENSDVWRSHCLRKLPEEALKSDLMSSVPTYKMKLRAYYHAWNPNDCSRNVYIKPNGFTLHRWEQKQTWFHL